MEEVNRSIKGLETHFSLQLERRDRLLKDSRDVIASASRTIINVHNGRTKDAERELARAKSLLAALKKSGDGPLARYLVSPETEYVEASAVVALAKGKPIPSRASLGSSPEAYLLGLLDTVGELKRLVLDSIMNGRVTKAKKYFSVMEELYSVCSPLAVYDHVANGARRKIDVARMLVEDTRGLLTEEVRRESVNSSLARLQKKLDNAARS
ncbi:MAG: RNA-binding protein [Thaumarchaeota archaeon]|nr:RNA-binding protein [Nitrososphaerota archaeon]